MAPTCFSICFSKAIPKGEYACLACSIIPLPSGGSVYLPVTNSYLGIFLDDNTDILATSLVISYCSFSSLILTSIVISSFYILFTRLFLKRKGSSDAGVASKAFLISLIIFSSSGLQFSIIM